MLYHWLGEEALKVRVERDCGWACFCNSPRAEGKPCPKCIKVVTNVPSNEAILEAMACPSTTG